MVEIKVRKKKKTNKSRKKKRRRIKGAANTLSRTIGKETDSKLKAPLTPAEYKFVKAYCRCLNASKAAAKAFNCSSKGSAGVVGHKQLRKDRVRKAIYVEMQSMARKVGLDEDKIIVDLENQKKAAFMAGQLSTAVRATELQGRYLGMFVDKKVFGIDEELVEKLEAKKKTLKRKLQRLAGEAD